jgi:hypothetical protein
VIRIYQNIQIDLEEQEMGSQRREEAMIECLLLRMMRR